MAEKHISRINKKNLPIYTFLAISLAIVLIGVIVVPIIIRTLERQYILLQADVNARQARSLALFVEERLKQGRTEEQVINEFQTMVAGSQADRGYSCMVDQGSSNFICHPMTQAVGMSVTTKNAEFEDWLGLLPRGKWEDIIAKDVSTGGILYLPDNQSEVVYMQAVGDRGWTISTHENTQRVKAELATMRKIMITASFLLGVLIAIPTSIAARKVSQRYEATIERQNEQIKEEQAKSERLLLNILPPQVAEELKSGKETIAERHSDVTVLFADLVGFTPLSGQMPAEELVSLLNQIFSAFDDLANKYQLEKIKTIGDSYMVCGGLPTPSHGSAVRVARMALDMIEILDKINYARKLRLSIRIGINTGEVVAGVIGKQKFIYDLWGDVVNIASRMESSGVPGRVQISQAAYDHLKDEFIFEDRGEIDVKGKGALRTYFLDSSTGAASV